jgi:D-alanyl-D-alanine carboxypeptidase
MSRIRVFISVVILICIVGLIAGCSGSSSIVPAAFSSETVQKMQKIVENTKSNYKLPGVIVGVWIPGMGEWIYASGTGDAATGQPVTTSDKMRIASITKPIPPRWCFS